MTVLFALADWLSDPVVLCFGCAIAWVFAVSYFPWEQERRVRAWFRLQQRKRRADRILWSGGAYTVSDQIRSRWRVL